MISLDDCVNRDELLSPNIQKFKHGILIRADPKDATEVITGIPLTHNITNQLVAFAEVRRERKINI